MRKPGAMATALVSSILLMLFVAIIGPVWQKHDDAVYALLADGRVILDTPVKTIPHMHPFVGVAAEGLRSLGADFSYATYIYLCLALAIAAIFYRINRDAKGPGLYLLTLAAVLPFVLLPQFTATAGFLVVAAAVLWLRDDRRGPDGFELLFGVVLLLLSAFFRWNMTALTAACLMPVVCWNIIAGRRIDRKELASFLVAGVAALGIFWATSAGLSHREIKDFKRLNKPAAIVLNYGYREAYRAFDLPPPSGVTETQLGLLWHWFFADPTLTNPETMAAVRENVPAEKLMRVRYWTVANTLKRLPFSLSFWVFIAAIWLASMSRLRGAIFASFAVFLLAAAYFSIVKKPFPERILMPIASGFFLMAAVSRCQIAPSGHRMPTWFYKSLPYAALIFFLPVAGQIIADRNHLARETDIWRRDSPQLARFDGAYAFVGLPFRAASRPFAFIGDEPDLKVLGTMYIVPAVQQAERETGCGGLVGCLLEGQSAFVTGTLEEVQLLKELVEERSGRSIAMEARATTELFTVYELGPEPGPP